MPDWSSSPGTQARPVPLTTSAAPPSRYLTRSATRKGTTNISHILLEQRPTTGRAARPSSTSLAKNGAGSKSSKPFFIEALNRVAAPADREEDGSTTTHHAEKAAKNVLSPAKPLPTDRKRTSSVFTNSPRGLEKSPNTRPRKAARMPQRSTIRVSPLKSLNTRPAIRSEVSPTEDVPKLVAGTFRHPSPSVSSITTPLQSVDGPLPSAKIESPAKVPVGSQTPFRFGTNRILDVPLSAVKKGRGRWSLASDLSDDFLLLQPSPKKPSTQDHPQLGRLATTSRPPLLQGRTRLFPLEPEKAEEDLELEFMEDSRDDIQVNADSQVEQQGKPINVANSLPGPMSNVSIDRQRKAAVPQKKTVTRFNQRAQKSLSLPRTTLSYAKHTASSAQAASITAVTRTARAALEEAKRQPVKKTHSTPAREVASSLNTPFSRPCGVQSRTSALSQPSDVASVGKSTLVASASGTTSSAMEHFKKPVSRVVPTSPEQRSPYKSLPIASKTSPRPSYTTLQPIPISSVPNHARRKSLTIETSKSLYGLSAALAKLTVKRPSLEGKSPDTSVSNESPSLQSAGRAESSTSGTQSGAKAEAPATDVAPRILTQPITISRIPKSISIQGRNSLSKLAEANRRLSGGPQESANDCILPITRKEPTQISVNTKMNRGIFHGVTVFIDVRTAEGDDSSAVFVDILRTCGARVSLCIQIAAQ
ncbi:hypothetical protein QFC19_001408 [Naganishia cerealis]|uniref:Uncharacterized protein n=1 Tax=Naganishia cerealis TaxID=610337 RepID=A0ACC2WI70_9TREE|nr:hypothetical protein QFC19_001408 [Naganishia cerealis]